MSDPLFAIRDSNDGDIPFVFNSFLKSYRDAYAVKGVPHTIYYREQHAIIERLLKTSTVRIACNPKDVDQIYGYIIAEGGNKVHWLYCKQPFRGNGIGRALIADCISASPIEYSHRLRNTERLIGSAPFVYNPFLGAA